MKPTTQMRANAAPTRGSSAAAAPGQTCRTAPLHVGLRRICIAAEKQPRRGSARPKRRRSDASLNTEGGAAADCKLADNRWKHTQCFGRVKCRPRWDRPLTPPLEKGSEFLLCQAEVLLFQPRPKGRGLDEATALWIQLLERLRARIGTQEKPWLSCRGRLVAIEKRKADPVRNSMGRRRAA